jgi:hypothetical protein
MIYALAYLWAFWLLYVLVMGFYRAKLAGRLKGLTLVMALPIVAIGLLVDLVANYTIATLVFADLPRERLVTDRLRRYIATGSGWRYTLADAVCNRLLDPFDPDGNHC